MVLVPAPHDKWPTAAVDWPDEEPGQPGADGAVKQWETSQRESKRTAPCLTPTPQEGAQRRAQSISCPGGLFWVLKPKYQPGSYKSKQGLSCPI